MLGGVADLTEEVGGTERLVAHADGAGVAFWAPTKERVRDNQFNWEDVPNREPISCYACVSMQVS